MSTSSNNHQAGREDEMGKAGERKGMGRKDGGKE